VLDNILVFPKQMKRNLELTHGLNMAEAVMIELTRRGMNRQEAHALLRKCSSTSVRNNIPLTVVLRREGRVTQYIPEREIEKLIDPRKYLGSAAATVERVVKELGPLARR
jgi:adenylosuccinate lyase